MEEARTRWLRPNEIHAMLCNYKYFPINVKPVNLPKSNYQLAMTSYLNSGCIVSNLHCHVLFIDIKLCMHLLISINILTTGRKHSMIIIFWNFCDFKLIC